MVVSNHQWRELVRDVFGCLEVVGDIHTGGNESVVSCSLQVVDIDAESRGGGIFEIALSESWQYEPRIGDAGIETCFPRVWVFVVNFHAVFCLPFVRTEQTDGETFAVAEGIALGECCLCFWSHLCIALLCETELEVEVVWLVKHGNHLHVDGVASAGGVAGSEVECHLLESLRVGKVGERLVNLPLVVKLLALEHVVLEEYTRLDRRFLSLVGIFQSW